MSFSARIMAGGHFQASLDRAEAYGQTVESIRQALEIALGLLGPQSMKRIGDAAPEAS